MARDTSKSRGGRGRRGSGSKSHALEQMERKGAQKKSLWRRLLSKKTSGHPAMSGRVVVQEGDEALIFVDGRPSTFHRGATIDTGRSMTAREYEALAAGPKAAEQSYEDRDASTKVRRRRRGGRAVSLKDVVRKAEELDGEGYGLEWDELSEATGASDELIGIAVSEGHFSFLDGILYVTKKGLELLGASVIVGSAWLAYQVLGG